MPFLGSKYAKIALRPGVRPGPCWGSLQRSPDPLAGLRGPTSKGKRRRGEGGRDGRGGKGGEGREKLRLLSQIPVQRPREKNVIKSEHEIL